jgi:hypothetical protein
LLCTEHGKGDGFPAKRSDRELPLRRVHRVPSLAVPLVLKREDVDMRLKKLGRFSVSGIVRVAETIDARGSASGENLCEGLQPFSPMDYSGVHMPSVALYISAATIGKPLSHEAKNE